MRPNLPGWPTLASFYKGYGRVLADAAILAATVVATYALVHSDGAVTRWLHDVAGLRSVTPEARMEGALVILFCAAGAAFFGFRRFRDQQREIAAHQCAEAKALSLALTDALTGLPNRRQFLPLLSGALAQIAAGGKLAAVMMIDLDHFKRINDVFGHAAGDRLLVAFAGRVSAGLGQDAVLARFGGDEFALLLGPTADVHAVVRTAAQLQELLLTPFDLAGVQVAVGASVGIAVAPQDGAEAEGLLGCADQALYQAKIDGRGRARVFDRKIGEARTQRLAIERDLRRALDEGEIFLAYQPIVALQSMRITGFEALARWVHPTLGEVPPSAFIKIAEDSGMIVPLSSRLLAMAIRDALDWPGDIRLCFNLSPTELAGSLMATRIRRILNEQQFDPCRLELEINEQTTAERLAAARPQLETLRQAGVSVSLDDFGVGSSSLQHLYECRVDRLKVDRSFVMAMRRDGLDLLAAILGLARALGIPVVAEGIEDGATAAQLRDLGYGEGQGYWFSKAVSPHDAAAMAWRDTWLLPAARGVDSQCALANPSASIGRASGARSTDSPNRG
jgi:diguanylate cyclase (GGDEF)-like protein